MFGDPRQCRNSLKLAKRPWRGCCRPVPASCLILSKRCAGTPLINPKELNRADCLLLQHILVAKSVERAVALCYEFAEHNSGKDEQCKRSFLNFFCEPCRRWVYFVLGQLIPISNKIKYEKTFSIY